MKLGAGRKKHGLFWLRRVKRFGLLRLSFEYPLDTFLETQCFVLNHVPDKLLPQRNLGMKQ